MDENKELSAEDLRWKELQNFFTELHKQEEENERKLRLMKIEQATNLFIEERNKQLKERQKLTEERLKIIDCYKVITEKKQNIEENQYKIEECQHKIKESQRRIEESEECIRNEFKKLSEVFPKGKIMEYFNLTPEQVNLYL